MKTWIQVMIFITGVILFLGFISWYLYEDNSFWESKADKLGCEHDYSSFCYKKNIDGDLIRYEIKDLKGNWRLVRK